MMTDKRQKGYVYSGKINSLMLEELLRSLFPDAVRLSWDLAQLDFLGKTRNAGTAFTNQAEMRWYKITEEDNRVLVLSDVELSLPEVLQRVEGDWQVQDEITRLIPLPSPQFMPQFREYPGGLKHARLRCHLFYKDGRAVFVSPRELMPDAPA